MEHRKHCPRALKLMENLEDYTCTCSDSSKYFKFTD